MNTNNTPATDALRAFLEANAGRTLNPSECATLYSLAEGVRAEQHALNLDK